MSAVILEVLRAGVRVRPPVIRPADKDEFSILTNHLNALVQEICSGAHTFYKAVKLENLHSSFEIFIIPLPVCSENIRWQTWR